MGKKSKKKSKPASDASKLAKDFSNKLKTIPSSGASCWICLHEDADDSGQPIRRDCSCRGDSGWVHLSCLIQCAETKSEEWIKKNGEMYWGTGMLAGGVIDKEARKTDPWMVCPNCRQHYISQFSIDIIDGKVTFVKKRFPCDPRITSENFPCDPFKYIGVLVAKLTTHRQFCEQVGLNSSEVAAQGREVACEIIALAAKMRDRLNHNRIPQSRERITHYEASMYRLLGDISLTEIADGVVSRADGLKEAVKNYEKSIELFKSIGDNFSASSVEICLGRTRKICKPKQRYNGKDAQREAKQDIHLLRERLKMAEGLGGGDGAESLAIKQDLAAALFSGGHVIEAERLAEELVNTSQRVNGKNHSATKGFEEFLNLAKRRRVQIRNGGPANYKLLRYTDSGDKCVLQGLMTREKFGERKGKTLTIDIGYAVILPPTPVVCVGLKGAKHLNGKIGDARDYDREKGRYVVVFEDNKLKPVLIKCENLRVLFDLPKEDE